MNRRIITDEIWKQIQSTMIALECYDVKNSRNVMEGILWKLRTGAPWRDIPKEICHWETAFGRFNRWAKNKLWDDFFLSYEAKLIRNGYSSTEVMSALISMRVELELEKNEPLDSPEEDLLLKYMHVPMRMETRSILKSLGVKSTTLKSPPKLFLK